MYTLTSDSAFRLRCVCVWAQTTKPVYTFDKDKDQEKDK